MSKKSYRDAIREAIASEMRRDHRVIVMGEDNAGGAGAPGEKDAWGGVLGVTKGLQPEFGAGSRARYAHHRERVHRRGGRRGGDGPAPRRRTDVRRLHGRLLRPDLQSGGEVSLHVRRTKRSPRSSSARCTAPGFRAASQHSQCLYPLFTHIPGLKVVLPSSPYDAKGLMIQAIRDDDPVIFFEHKLMYDETAEVPDESYTIPFGEANVTREGRDATIVAFGRMVNLANQAADELKREGVSVTVIDPRTTSPLDTETILDSVAETGRLVVVDEAHPRCSMAADIARLVAEEAFGHLKAPIKTVTAPHTPVPFSPALEDLYVPSPAKIRDAVLAVTRGARLMSEIQPIVMPKWGLAMEEGTLTAWLVQDGSQIEKGQEIAEIETTKIANVFESPVSGTLRRLVAKQGDVLPVGALLAVLAPPAVSDADDRRLCRGLRGRRSDGR